MATQTPNYGLPKPEGSDVPDISVFGTAMDKIDAQMKASADNIGLLHFSRVDTTQSDWKITLEALFQSIPIGRSVLIYIGTTGTAASGHGIKIGSTRGVFSVISLSESVITLCTRADTGVWTYVTK